MKFEAAIVLALVCSLVTSIASGSPAHRHHRALPHRTASMPHTTASWTEHTNSYRSVVAR